MLEYPEFQPRFRELTLELRPVAVRKAGDKAALAEESEPLWIAVAAGERAVASVLLVILLPLLISVALIVILLSRRPPIVAHARAGRNGREFWVVKLRTMWGGPQQNSFRNGIFIERLRGTVVPDVKQAGDPRVTSAFAAFCRKYSIDELPQLWHVITGEMSMVGPRPMTIEELSQHYGPAAAEVLRFKPGLTGLWQVKGRSRLNYRQRRRLDLFLVRHWSFRLYLALLLATIPRVLLGTDAW